MFVFSSVLSNLLLNPSTEVFFFKLEYVLFLIHWAFHFITVLFISTSFISFLSNLLCHISVSFADAFKLIFYFLKHSFFRWQWFQHRMTFVKGCFCCLRLLTLPSSEYGFLGCWSLDNLMPRLRKFSFWKNVHLILPDTWRYHQPLNPFQTRDSMGARSGWIWAAIPAVAGTSQVRPHPDGIQPFGIPASRKESGLYLCSPYLLVKPAMLPGFSNPSLTW